MLPLPLHRVPDSATHGRSIEVAVDDADTGPKPEPNDVRAHDVGADHLRTDLGADFVSDSGPDIFAADRWPVVGTDHH